ncbi:MAG: histidinol dehydrogenase, partial [Thermoguttaceae bacterium]|nr:histidinol dehydrogenase [Thermoguttaceae bacterium]
MLTFWPWPSRNFEGRNDCVRAIAVDDNGDGKADRTVTVAMPILHFLGLVARMGPQFWVLAERTVGGHVAGGFASRVDGKLYVLLYAHHALDTESRSEAEFDVTLGLAGLEPGKVRVVEYRFDKDHNSYFRLGRQLRDEPLDQATADLTRLENAMRLLESSSRQEQLAGLEGLAGLGQAAAQAAGAVFLGPLATVPLGDYAAGPSHVLPTGGSAR